MAKKIEINGSALIVTDTISGLIIISQPSKDIWYKEKDLSEIDRVSFYDANGIQGGAIYSKDLVPFQLSEAIDKDGTPFNQASFREFCVNYLGYDRLSDETNSVNQLGWALYRDTVYTSASPLVVSEGSKVDLNNNAGSTITSHLPIGVTSLYDEVTKKITPVKLGDTMDLRIAFKCFTSINTGYGEVSVNIGGAIGDILTIPVNFPRGTGSINERNFVETNLIYSLDTFMQNGGALHYESVRGETSICDIEYTILITSKGK